MSQDIRICFIGDSFVNGTGDRTYLGWTGRLCLGLAERGLAVTYYNLGVRRDTSVDIAHRWERETATRLPQDCDNRIVFSFGTNDTTLENERQRVPMPNALQSCRQILKSAQDQYPVLLIGPPPIADSAQNTRTRDLSERFSELCADLNVPYLDIFTPLSQSTAWQEAVEAGDGAHPGAEGYGAIAHLIQAWPTWKQWFDAP
ncbi:GDSL-type esterase/lipase family protein [Altericista sp. CCNU0014]|uniref:GDSL-type esterase/lipase family protein n=1 Tax=Altericista sp. CCNU0014 TaxID=3082949 RepID=UPI00384EB61B